jgi:hypothetical protein
MTDFFEPFDPSQYQGSTYDLLPIGIYSAQIIEAEITVPQSLDGQGVKLVWSITNGEYANRQVWHRITFAHSNPQAQDIGRRQLKDLCEACGITTSISNPEPFKFIECKIRIGIEKDKDGVYDDKNVVTRMWPASHEPPRPRARPPKPQAASPPKPAAASFKSSSKSPAAASIDAMMKDVRFTDYQPPSQNSPQTPTPPQQTSPQTSSSVIDDEVKAMIIALRTKSGLSPQEISEAMAKINVKIPAVMVESLLVVWGKYDIGVAAGSRANGGGTPSQAASQASAQNSQGSPQTPSQTSSQGLSQGLSQGSPHSDTPPWRDQS